MCTYVRSKMSNSLIQSEQNTQDMKLKKKQIFVKKLKLYAKYIKLVGIFFSTHIVIIELRIHCKLMKININYFRKIKIYW